MEDDRLAPYQINSVEIEESNHVIFCADDSRDSSSPMNFLGSSNFTSDETSTEATNVNSLSTANALGSICTPESKSVVHEDSKTKSIYSRGLELEPGEDIDISFSKTEANAGEANAESDMQVCRAELRERFLWAMTGLIGRKVHVAMLENLNVSGTLRGIDKDGLVVHTEKLTTPLAVLPWASLRLPDCLTLTVNLEGNSN